MTELELEDIKSISSLNYNWDKFKGKTVLISGGTGFIGQFIINVIKYRNATLNNDIKVISLSRRTKVNEPFVEYVQQDITQQISIDGKVDFILHLASNTHPKQYASDPIGTITTNVIGCHNLLELAKIKKATFLLASSVEIYGNGTEEPMNESYCGYIDCNTARAGYNESKRVSESLCQSYRLQYGLTCQIARLSRCFGADRKDDSKAIAQFIKNSLNGEDIVLKSKGTQRFSYCYVADAASGLLKVLLDGKDGEAYNIAEDDEGLTLGDYARYIAALAGKKVIFDLDSKQQGESVSVYALQNCDKLKALEWRPLYSVRSGLERTYKILSSDK